jgi:hypothetical protein
MRLALFASLALASLAFTPSAHAFWCGGRLVLEGDRIHEVRSRCGEPASEVTRMESVTSYSGGVSGGRRGSVYGGIERTVTVQIDILVYDFGPTRFMEELRFEDGILRSMTRLGRGSRRSSIELPAIERLASTPMVATLRRFTA